VNKIPTPPPHSFAALARRLSSITSRILLSAVIVIAGIGVGRQILSWWREAADAPQQAPLPVAGLGDPSAVHEIVLADRPWAIVQQSFQGDAGEAADALLSACHRAAKATEAMPLPPPGPEEQQLLDRLERARPERRSPGGVSLYALREAVPLVVGIRTARGAHPATAESHPGVTGPSVAVWGMAVPAASNQWSLYTFQPSKEPSEKGSLPQPPIPPECRRLLQVRAVGGDRSIVFTGRSAPRAWRAFYDHWAAEVGLEPIGGWQESGGIWRVTYRAADPGSAAVVHVHMDTTAGKAHRGIVLVVPESLPDS